MLALALAACKAPGPAFDSGLPPGKQADALTPAEQVQLCEAQDAHAQGLIDDVQLEAAICTIYAIGFALADDQSVAACVRVRDACVAEPDAPGEGTCDLGIDWTRCTATVAELEACYDEYGRASAAQLRSYSCDRMAEYAVSPPSGDLPPLGAACSRAQSECPSVLGDSSGAP